MSRDLAPLARTVAQKIRDFGERLEAKFAAEINRIEARFADLPAPQSLDVPAIVAEVVRVIPPAKDGNPGKDAPPVDTAALVAEVLRQIPPAQPGKDADPVDITAIVSEVLLQVPPPKDGSPGKDATVDSAAIAADVLRQIPAPQPGPAGQDAVVDVPAIVARVIEQLDPQKIKTLQAFIVAEVARSIADLPKPTNGLPGAPGKDGESVHHDTVALMVRDAVSRAVESIPRAQNGEPGRDALQLDIIPSIDPAKSYPRGTYAKHQGGLWRSLRFTTAGNMGDWESIIDGPETLQVIQSENLRTFQFQFIRADGSNSRSQEFSVPVMIYRDIWKDGEPYMSGDVVTWAGNLWLCRAESTQVKPERTNDWQLIVRRGGDGRPGKDGEPGKPGLQGPPGRDLTQLGFDGRKH
jgi:hypothetical protein